MIEIQPHRKQERALLIGLEKEGVSKWDLRDSLEELRERRVETRILGSYVAARVPAVKLEGE